MEIWVDINGFENIYQLSNYGKIKNIRKGTMKKNGIQSNGYEHIHLYKDGVCYPKLIHRLVAQYFIENPFNKPCVNHKDGNKQNNHVDNLEWVTYQENADHAWENNLYSKDMDRPWVRGSNSGKSKLNEALAKEIFDLSNHRIFSFREIAKLYNISNSVVAQIKNKKAWIHIHK